MQCHPSPAPGCCQVRGNSEAKKQPPCHLTRGPGDSEREGLPAGGALQCQRGLHTGQVFISLCQELGYSPQVELADCTELAGQCKHMYWFRNNHKAGMLCPQFRPARKWEPRGNGLLQAFPLPPTRNRCIARDAGLPPVEQMQPRLIQLPT